MNNLIIFDCASTVYRVVELYFVIVLHISIKSWGSIFALPLQKENWRRVTNPHFHEMTEEPS